MALMCYCCFYFLQVDIGQGLRIPLETWRRVQARDKDSLFIKDLLVTIWDPAQLQGRSLQGNFQYFELPVMQCLKLLNV